MNFANSTFPKPQPAIPSGSPTFGGALANGNVRPTVDWNEIQWTADSTNTLRRFGFYVALALFFVRFSMLGEVLEFGLGARAFLVVALGPIAVLLVLVSGGVKRSMRQPSAYFVVAYLAWLLICAPFSVWKGGTWTVLRSAFLTEFSMFFIVAGLVLTMDEVHKLVKAASLAASLDLVALLVFGDTSSGRFSMAFGTLQNPNDLAVHLIATCPLVLLSIQLSSTFSIGRVIGLITIPGILYTLLLTGSRMALVSVGITTVFALIRASMKQRALFIGLIVPITIGGLMLLPAAARQRYLSVFSQSQTVATSAELQASEEARGSTEARLQLLEASVKLTLKNPLFGVGPGQFAVEEAENAKQVGRRAHWQVTHNTYTEISSEAGIPALIFFVSAIVSSLIMLNRILVRVRRSPDQAQMGSMAFYMMMSLLGFATCSLFGSMAYRFYMPSLVAMGVIISSACLRQLAIQPVTPARRRDPAPQFPQVRHETSLPKLEMEPGPVRPRAARGSGVKRISPLRH